MAKARPMNVPGENRLLARLPGRELDRLRPRLEATPLDLKQVIYEAGGPIEHVYFPRAGVISLVIEMAGGMIVEVATVGNEGIVGTPVFLGAETSPTKAFCQVPGEGLRMRADAFREEVGNGGPLPDLIRRHTQAMLNQISQSVACNHLHSVQERMCRWLLMTHDRAGSDDFPLTHEFLAQMLGVRRPSVTVVAGILQQAGLIRYHRGRIEVLDRPGLEAGSCECYGVVRAEYDRLLGPPPARG